MPTMTQDEYRRMRDVLDAHRMQQAAEEQASLGYQPQVEPVQPVQQVQQQEPVQPVQQSVQPVQQSGTANGDDAAFRQALNAVDWSKIRPERTLGGTLKDAGITLANAAIGAGEGVVGLANLATLGGAGKVMDSIGYDAKAARDYLNQYKSAAQKFADREVEEAGQARPGEEGFGGAVNQFGRTLGAMWENPSTILTTAVESAPSMFLGGAVGKGAVKAASAIHRAHAAEKIGEGAATRLASKIVSPGGVVNDRAAGILAGVGEGVVAGGMQAEQIRQESPDRELTPRGILSAAAAGTFTGILGRIGNKISKRLGVTDVDRAIVSGVTGSMARTAGGTVGQEFKKMTAGQFAKAVTGGAITEGLFEELPQSAQEQFWTNYALERPLWEGIGAAAAQGMAAGFAMGGAANVYAGMPWKQREAWENELARQKEAAREKAAQLEALVREAVENSGQGQVSGQLLRGDEEEGSIAAPTTTAGLSGYDDASGVGYMPVFAAQEQAEERNKQWFANAKTRMRQPGEDAAFDELLAAAQAEAQAEEAQRDYEEQARSARRREADRFAGIQEALGRQREAEEAAREEAYNQAVQEGLSAGRYGGMDAPVQQEQAPVQQTATPQGTLSRAISNARARGDIIDSRRGQTVPRGFGYGGLPTAQDARDMANARAYAENEARARYADDVYSGLVEGAEEAAQAERGRQESAYSRLFSDQNLSDLESRRTAPGTGYSVPYQHIPAEEQTRMYRDYLALFDEAEARLQEEAFQQGKGKGKKTVIDDERRQKEREGTSIAEAYDDIERQGVAISDSPFDVNAKDLRRGDRVVIRGQDGLPDIATVRGYDDHNRMVIEDGVKYLLTPNSKISVEGVRLAGEQSQTAPGLGYQPKQLREEIANSQPLVPEQRPSGAEQPYTAQSPEEFVWRLGRSAAQNEERQEEAAQRRRDYDRSIAALEEEYRRSRGGVLLPEEDAYLEALRTAAEIPRTRRQSETGDSSEKKASSETERASKDFVRALLNARLANEERLRREGQSTVATEDTGAALEETPAPEQSGLGYPLALSTPLLPARVPAGTAEEGRETPDNPPFYPPASATPTVPAAQARRRGQRGGTEQPALPPGTTRRLLPAPEQWLQLPAPEGRAASQGLGYPGTLGPSAQSIAGNWANDAAIRENATGRGVAEVGQEQAEGLASVRAARQQGEDKYIRDTATGQAPAGVTQGQAEELSRDRGIRRGATGQGVAERTDVGQAQDFLRANAALQRKAKRAQEQSVQSTGGALATQGDNEAQRQFSESLQTGGRASDAAGNVFTVFPVRKNSQVIGYGVVKRNSETNRTEEIGDTWDSKEQAVQAALGQAAFSGAAITAGQTGQGVGYPAAGSGGTATASSAEAPATVPPGAPASTPASEGKGAAQAGKGFGYPPIKRWEGENTIDYGARVRAWQDAKARGDEETAKAIETRPESGTSKKRGPAKREFIQTLMDTGEVVNALGDTFRLVELQKKPGMFRVRAVRAEDGEEIDITTRGQAREDAASAAWEASRLKEGIQDPEGYKRRQERGTRTERKREESENKRRYVVPAAQKRRKEIEDAQRALQEQRDRAPELFPLPPDAPKRGRIENGKLERLGDYMKRLRAWLEEQAKVKAEKPVQAEQTTKAATEEGVDAEALAKAGKYFKTEALGEPNVRLVSVNEMIGTNLVENARTINSVEYYLDRAEAGDKLDPWPVTLLPSGGAVDATFFIHLKGRGGRYALVKVKDDEQQSVSKGKAAEKTPEAEPTSDQERPFDANKPYWHWTAEDWNKLKPTNEKDRILKEFYLHGRDAGGNTFSPSLWGKRDGKDDVWVLTVTTKDGKRVRDVGATQLWTTLANAMKAAGAMANLGVAEEPTPVKEQLYYNGTALDADGNVLEVVLEGGKYTIAVDGETPAPIQWYGKRHEAIAAWEEAVQRAKGEKNVDSGGQREQGEGKRWLSRDEFIAELKDKLRVENPDGSVFTLEDNGKKGDKQAFRLKVEFPQSENREPHYTKWGNEKQTLSLAWAGTRDRELQANQDAEDAASGFDASKYKGWTVEDWKKLKPANEAERILKEFYLHGRDVDGNTFKTLNWGNEWVLVITPRGGYSLHNVGVGQQWNSKRDAVRAAAEALANLGVAGNPNTLDLVKANLSHYGVARGMDGNILELRSENDKYAILVNGKYPSNVLWYEKKHDAIDGWINAAQRKAEREAKQGHAEEDRARAEFVEHLRTTGPVLGRAEANGTTYFVWRNPNTSKMTVTSIDRWGIESESVADDEDTTYEEMVQQLADYVFLQDDLAAVSSSRTKFINDFINEERATNKVGTTYSMGVSSIDEGQGKVYSVYAVTSDGRGELIADNIKTQEEVRQLAAEVSAEEEAGERKIAADVKPLGRDERGDAPVGATLEDGEWRYEKRADGWWRSKNDGQWQQYDRPPYLLEARWEEENPAESNRRRYPFVPSRSVWEWRKKLLEAYSGKMREEAEKWGLDRLIEDQPNAIWRVLSERVAGQKGKAKPEGKVEGAASGETAEKSETQTEEAASGFDASKYEDWTVEDWEKLKPANEGERILRDFYLKGVCYDADGTRFVITPAGEWDGKELWTLDIDTKNRARHSHVGLEQAWTRQDAENAFKALANFWVEAEVKPIAELATSLERFGVALDGPNSTVLSVVHDARKGYTLAEDHLMVTRYATGWRDSKREAIEVCLDMYRRSRKGVAQEQTDAQSTLTPSEEVKSANPPKSIETSGEATSGENVGGENKTAERPDLATVREWTKPGVTTFFGKRGYKVLFNGSEESTGYSDGHVLFFDFVPEAVIPPEGDDAVLHASFGDQEKDGSVTGFAALHKGTVEDGDVYDNPLTYIGRYSDKGETYIFELERNVGLGVVGINAGYVNAIMYYARERYGKDADIQFIYTSQDRRKSLGIGSVAVVVNGKPFALVMPSRLDHKTKEDVVGVVEAYEQGLREDEAEERAEEEARQANLAEVLKKQKAAFTEEDRKGQRAFFDDYGKGLDPAPPVSPTQMTKSRSIDKDDRGGRTTESGYVFFPDGSVGMRTEHGLFFADSCEGQQTYDLATRVSWERNANIGRVPAFSIATFDAEKGTVTVTNCRWYRDKASDPYEAETQFGSSSVTFNFEQDEANKAKPLALQEIVPSGFKDDKTGYYVFASRDGGTTILNYTALNVIAPMARRVGAQKVQFYRTEDGLVSVFFDGKLAALVAPLHEQSKSLDVSVRGRVEKNAGLAKEELDGLFEGAVAPTDLRKNEAKAEGKVEEAVLGVGENAATLPTEEEVLAALHSRNRSITIGRRTYKLIGSKGRGTNSFSVSVSMPSGTRYELGRGGVTQAEAEALVLAEIKRVNPEFGKNQSATQAATGEATGEAGESKEKSGEKQGEALVAKWKDRIQEGPLGIKTISKTHLVGGEDATLTVERLKEHIESDLHPIYARQDTESVAVSDTAYEANRVADFKQTYAAVLVEQGEIRDGKGRDFECVYNERDGYWTITTKLFVTTTFKKTTTKKERAAGAVPSERVTAITARDGIVSFPTREDCLKGAAELIQVPPMLSVESINEQLHNGFFIENDRYQLEFGGKLIKSTADGERTTTKLPSYEAGGTKEDIANDVLAILEKEHPKYFAALRGEQTGKAQQPAGDSSPAARNDSEEKRSSEGQTQGPAPTDATGVQDGKGIADKLGEHIGGSRADEARKTGTKESLPKWAKGYSIRKEESGKYVIHVGATPYRGFFAHTFEEALDYLSYIVLSHNFYAAPSRYAERGHGPYTIVGRTKRESRRGFYLDGVPDFATEQMAEQYAREHIEELVEKRNKHLEEDKAGRRPREKGFTEGDLVTAKTSERVGKERRTGDATPDDFLSAFGFRGVEFGLWNNQKERQALLNDAYDALMDLADLLNIPAKAVSLNGELALAFGARGRGGKARAHFEPGRVVINLTKTSGKGSLAHEWMHALDNYFGRKEGGYDAISEMSRTSPRNIRREVYSAFKRLKSAIEETPDGMRFTNYYRAAGEFNNVHYWRNSKELLARAFSAYIEDKLAARGEKSNFLSYGSNNEKYGKDWPAKPFPEGEEREAINKAFDEFFSTLKVDDSEGKAALYSIADDTVIENRPIRRDGEPLADYKARVKSWRDRLKREVQAAVDMVRKLVPGLTVKTTTDLDRELGKLKGKVRYLRDADGQIVGAYHAGSKTVLLTPDADAGTVLHEIGWHAMYDWAKANAPELYRQMRRFALEAPEEVQAWVKERYGRFSAEGLLDEIGAKLFTEQGREEFENAVKSRASRRWYQRLADFFRELWGRFTGAHRADLGAYRDLTPEAAMKRLLSDILEGRRFGEQDGVRSEERGAGRGDMLVRFAKELGVTPEQLQREYDAVVAQYRDTEQWLKAPNGKDSNLNERQWVLVRTPRFKKWFGDWENDPENASRVVDENGEPRVIDGFFVNSQAKIRKYKQEYFKRYYEFGEKLHELNEDADSFKDALAWALNTGDAFVTDFFDKNFGYSTPDTDAHNLMVAGFYGFTPEYKIAIRHKDLPPDGISTNHATGEAEKGLSVVDFLSNNVKDGLITETFYDISNKGNKKYVVGGWYLGRHGSDGEPLLLLPTILGETKDIGKVVKSATENTGAFDPENPDIRYSFAGERGAAALDQAEEATTRLDNLAIAREMEEAGKDAKTVKLATGWERGKDGKWRYEIDDSANKVDLTAAENGSATLSEVLDAPELFKAYPQLRDVRVEVVNLPGANGGKYIAAYNAILLSNTLAHDDERTTLQHEIQHAIQEIEGFARGGSPEAFRDYGRERLANEAYDQLQDIERQHRDAVQQVLEQQLPAYLREWTDVEVDKDGRFSEPYENIGGKDVNSLREMAQVFTDQMIDKRQNPETALAEIVQGTDGAVHEFFETNGVYDKSVPELDRITEKYKAKRAEMEAISAGTQDPLKTYQRLAGEAESRNVERRLSMTAEERRASLAEETEDVAREDQIVLNEMLGNAASAARPANNAVTPEEDAAYMEAVERGDMETAQKMVDDAAKRAGYKQSNGFYILSDLNPKDKPRRWDLWAYGVGQQLREKYKGGPIDWTAEIYGDFEYTANGITASINELFTGDDYGSVDTTKGMAAYLDAGFYGLEPPAFVFARRIGNVPDSGASYNFRDEAGEGGVSVLGVYESGQYDEQNNGTYRLFNGGKEYIVAGFLNPKTGSDGEPLLNHAATLTDVLGAIKSADPVTYNDNGDVISLSRRFNVDNNDVRFSSGSEQGIAAVPVKNRADIEAELEQELGAARTRKLTGGRNGRVAIVDSQEEARRIIAESGRETARKSTSTAIAEKYPNWMDNQVITTDGKKGQQTQIEGTRGTYAKLGRWIQANLGMNVQVLDASSGMGLGTVELREQGFATDDIEPYPGKVRMESNPPTFFGTDAYQQAMNAGKQYDFIISNAVLNVIPDDWRNAVLRDMAALLKPGGKMFINTRKAGEEKSIKNKIELDSPQEVLVGTPDRITSYQRFFTPKGLVEYVQGQLGDGYTVEVANTKNSGTSGLAAVVVTKKGEAVSAKAKDSRLEQAAPDETLYSVSAKGGKTKIARSKYGVGKAVGKRIYFHKQYAGEIVPSEALKKAQAIAAREGFAYNAMMYDESTGLIRFDEAPDFDSAREPVTGRSLSVFPDGKTKYSNGSVSQEGQIWHHKWLWVKDDYKGFDVAESRSWSKTWLNANAGKGAPSGYMEQWNQRLKEVGLGDYIVESAQRPEVRYSEDGRTIQGFYLNGKVYLVRDGIAKGQTMPVLMHELGEHAAQLGFANDVKYRAILKSLENRKNEKSANGEAIRAAMQRAEDAGLTQEDKHYWSEVAAYMVEQYGTKKASLLDKIVNFFKGLLYRVGAISADRFSQKDLALFAQAAVRAEARRAERAGERDTVRYSFAGERGAAALDQAEEATARLDNLAVAREMEEAGKDAKTVKLATGWERGKDGKWRYEVDDSNTRVNLAALQDGTAKLPDVLNATELFKAYPDLQGVTVEIDDSLPENTGGQYYRLIGKIGLNRRVLNADEDNVRLVLHHEVQHAIQEIEGFEQGGSLESAAYEIHEANKRKWEKQLSEEWAKLDAKIRETDDRIHDLRVKYGVEEYSKDLRKRAQQGEITRSEYLERVKERIATIPELNDAVAARERLVHERFRERPELEPPKSLSYNDALNMYRRFAGEVESRNVQRRMNMTPEQRRASLASETEDVAREDQIVLQDMLGGAAASMAKPKTGKEAAERIMGLFQTAYHGSPYRFDKFTLDNIGGGEGSQVHGWGLYFALDRRVSEKYKLNRKSVEYLVLRTLADEEGDIGSALVILEEMLEDRVYTIEYDVLDELGHTQEAKEARERYKNYVKELDEKYGVDGRSWSEDEFSRLKQLGKARDDAELKSRKRAEIQERAKEILADDEEYRRILAAIKILQEEDIDKIYSGRLYRVDIPEDSEMLREDASLADQPEQVKQSLERVFREHADDLEDRDKLLLAALQGNGEITGKTLYWELADALGSPKAASLALNEAGIKGIRYDGRSDGECAVVWDDTAIEILETYHQAQKDGLNPQEALRKLYGQRQAEAGERAMQEAGEAPGLVPRRQEGEDLKDYLKRRQDWAQGQKGELWRQVQKQIRETLKDKAQSGAIISIIAARAASAGISSEEYVARRGLEIRQQRGVKGLRGGFNSNLYHEEGRAIISAFEEADVSTLAHELAHLFRQDLKRYGQERLLETAEKWAGVKGGKWTREQEERFAEAFETYLYEGKAPTEKLRGVFARFRAWLAGIYRALTGSPLADRLSPEITRVFDALLTEGAARDVEQAGYFGGRGADGVLYQAAPTSNSGIRGWIDRLLDNAAPDVRDRWERFVYNFLDTNDPRERIWAAAGKDADHDIVTVERLRGKKAAAESEAFRERMVKPLLATLAKAKLKASDLEEYAHALHVPERNQRMREVNAKRYLDSLLHQMTGSEAKPFKDQIELIQKQATQAGWTSRDKHLAYLQMMGQVFADIPTRELVVQAMPDSTEREQKLKALAAKRLERTRRIKEKWDEESPRFAGMTDKEAQSIIVKWHKDSRFAKLQDAHSQLRDITKMTLAVLHEGGELSDEEYDDLLNGYLHYVPLHRAGFMDTAPTTGRITGPTGKPLKVAKGSMREVVNILPEVLKAHETAISRKHKLLAGKVLYEWALANPDAGITVESIPKEPTHDKEGNIVMYPSQQEPPDGVFVKVDGKKHLLRFAVDPKTPEGRTMERFLDSIKGTDAQLGGITKGLHRITRWLAAVNTMYSPEFVVSNFARDLQTALVHLNQEDINMDGLQRQVLSDIPKALRGIWQSERGKGKGKEWSNWYKDFAAHGGKVGWMQGYEGIDEIVKTIETEMKLAGDGHHLRKGFENVKNFIESANKAVENCLRLATYKTMVERGVARDRAARVASGLTVDFTQHGKLGPQINALYLFFNASVQGTVRMGQAMAKSKRVRRIAGALAGLGFMLQMLALAGGGDDDTGEPYILGIPEYERQRSIIIMLPGQDGRYIKIPKAYGYGALYDLGAELANSIYMSATGRKYDHAKGAMRVVSSLANSFNPVHSATMLQTLAPTLVDPAVYTAENKTWSGQPLMPEQNQFGPQKPDSQRVWKSTGPAWRTIAETANSITGGDTYEGGLIDVSPETLEMLWDNALGSAGRFVGNVAHLPATLMQDETDISKVPFARTVTGKWSDRTISNRYHDAMERAQIANMRFKNAETLEERRRIFQGDDYILFRRTHEIDKRVKRLRNRLNQIEAAGNTTGAEHIRKQILNLQKRSLQMMN